METKIEKLKKILEISSRDTISASEIERFLVLVLNTIKESKNSFDKISKENISKIEEALILVENKGKDLSKFNDEISEVKKLLDSIKKIKATPGKDGKDYVLTNLDKEEIASLIDVPIVEKVIEKTEVIKEVQTEILGETIVDKINELDTTPENQIDAKHIKNLPEVKQFIGGSASRILAQLTDVNISNPTNDQVLKFNSVTNLWENVTGGGGSFATLTGDPYDNANLTIALNAKQNSITTGTTAQYLRGDLSLATFPTALSSFTNDSGYITGNQSITLSGDITGSGTTGITTTIANGAVDIAMLSATGTPSSTTYLRGDNTWATIAGGSQTPWTSNINADGYTLYGNDSASGNLTLGSTSNATKGKILFGTSGYDEVNNRLGIGTSSPSFELHTVGAAYNTGKLYAAITSGNVQFGSTLNTGQVNFSVKQSTNTGLGWIFGYDSFSTNGFYIYTNETTANPNFNIYTGATQRLTIYSTTSMVLNEAGANFDIRMEGDTNVNLFFLDASVDSIGIGHGAPDRLLHVEQADAVTNAVTYPFRVTHTSSGTVATNFGVGQEFEAENASNTNRVIGTHEFIYSDATNATEDASYKLRLIKAGTLTDALTVDSIGNGTFAGVVKTAGYTVATLPTGVIGYRAYVTDALTPTFGATVVGGGAVTIPVFFDGTNWIVG